MNSNPFLPASYTPAPEPARSGKAREYHPPRPYRCFYYAAARDAGNTYSMASHATHVEGAIRASLTRLHRRLYAACAIYDEDRYLVALVRRQGDTIEVWCPD